MRLPRFITTSGPLRSEDAADISALVFTVLAMIAMIAVGLALTIGFTLAIAWAIRGSLAPLIGVA